MIITLAITLLTVVLVLICILIGGLVLMQLPKKDAGAGLAFGGGAAEALFGAGATTPLAQITKYCAAIFLLLSLTLSALHDYESSRIGDMIEEEAASQDAQPSVPDGAGTAPPPAIDGTPLMQSAPGDGAVPSGGQEGGSVEEGAGAQPQEPEGEAVQEGGSVEEGAGAQPQEPEGEAVQEGGSGEASAPAEEASEARPQEPDGEEAREGGSGEPPAPEGTGNP